MAKACRKCGVAIPSTAWVDGVKKVNLQNRSYCLTCSPFGSHNTRPLDQPRIGERRQLACERCARPMPARQAKGRRCWSCYLAERSSWRSDLVYGIVGEACWKCGYSRGRPGRRILDFHHADRAGKRFCLDARNISNLSIARVLDELLKCVLLCANCHREVEAGLVPVELVDRIHRQQWANRTASVDACRPGAQKVNRDA